MKFHPVTPERWGDMERLFEGRGAPKFCWCMAYRSMEPPFGRADSASKKEAMRRLVKVGTPVGILGYQDGEPVAWCSVAPIETYRSLRGRNYRPEVDEDLGAVWSIGCFYVKSEFRRRGLTGELITAAIEYAEAKGANVVEGYPVDRDSPSYLFMGFVETFEGLGFQEVGMVGIRRHMMRLFLD